MIQIFLVIYALITLIPFGYWMREVYLTRKKSQKKTVERDAADQAMIDLQAALEKQGIKAKLHRVPEDPIEAIIVQSSYILDVLGRMEKGQNQWFTHLERKLGEHGKDLYAIMQSEQAVLKNVSELTSHQIAPVTDTAPATKTHQQFATYFEYARDNLPVDPKEKEVINTIIKRLKEYV